MKKLIYILLLLFSLRLFSQDIAVPVEAQLPIFFKIFAYDKNLNQRIGNHFDILIVYQKKFRTSLNIKNSIQALLESEHYKTYNSIPINIKAVSIESGSELEDFLNKNHTDYIYVTPLRAIEISAITEITRRKKILTITGVPEYVVQGVSVGIGIKAEKPQILINITASKAEGSNFSSQLLKLAKIIE